MGKQGPKMNTLEWHVTRDAQQRITSVQFTCDGWDYWEFRGSIERMRFWPLTGGLSA